jgi:glycosyltransferase involved in cell wall biosynthesis
MKVMHIITRMIVGGAQENTLLNCLDLIRSFRDEVVLVTGPSLGAEGDLLEQTKLQLDELKIQSVPNLIRAIHPWKDALASRDLKQLIRNWQPDVVHTHSAKGGLLGRMAAWHCRVPCVVHTVHGAPFHPYQNPWSRRFFVLCERWASKRCHHMISVADAMTSLMVEAGVASSEKFTTVYSGMDVEPFVNADSQRQAMRSRLGFSENDVVYGKIARLFHLKGHEYVIEAAKKICSENGNLKFLFVGDGLLREAYEADIQRAGLQDRFVFAGLVPPSDVPSYIGAMDVLVHTSLREGLARALPQALISGKPAISFDVDGAREVVINGQTGCLIAPKDIAGLVQAIRLLSNDSDLRKKLGRTGQSRFTQQFRHQYMTERIRKIYSAELLRSANGMR